MHCSEKNTRRCGYSYHKFYRRPPGNHLEFPSKPCKIYEKYRNKRKAIYVLLAWASWMGPKFDRDLSRNIALDVRQKGKRKTLNLWPFHGTERLEESTNILKSKTSYLFTVILGCNRWSTQTTFLLRIKCKARFTLTPATRKARASRFPSHAVSKKAKCSFIFE